MRAKVIAALFAVIASGSTVGANHWMQTADPQVVQALNELVSVYGSACQYGNQQACQMANLVQQQGAVMLNAGYECQANGNPQACQFYQYSYGQLEQAYYATQQAINQGRFQAQQPGYDSSTHAQRMQQIHNWGQQRLEWGRQQQSIMDQNHQQFMDYIRQ